MFHKKIMHKFIAYQQMCTVRLCYYTGLTCSSDTNTNMFVVDHKQLILKSDCLTNMNMFADHSRICIFTRNLTYNIRP